MERGAAIPVSNIVTIAHQAALLDKFTVGIHRGDGVTRCYRNNLLASARKEWVAPEKKRISAPLSQRSEGRIDLARCTSIENKQLNAKSAGRLLRVAQYERGFRSPRVRQQRDESGFRKHLVQ